MTLKRLILRFVLAIVVLVAGILVYALTLPSTFHVERSIEIAAAPAKIMPLLTDFRRWTAWLPWEHVDPDMKRTYSSASSGVGAVYQWSGNSKVGSGGMQITQVVDPTFVKIRLTFIEPFASQNETTFTLLPQGTSTTVRWAMDGPSPYASKVMSVFASMDKMVGGDFQTGLDNLKAVAEH